MEPWEVLLQTVHQLKGAPICLCPRGHCCKLFYECQKTIRRWKETTFHGESTPIIAKLLSLKVCWNLVVIMKILLKLWNSVKVVEFCQICMVWFGLEGPTMNNELVMIVNDLGGSDIYLGGGVFPLSSAIKLSYSLSSWNKGNWNMLKYARVRHASLIVKIRVPDPPVQVRPICQGGRFLALFQEALDALVCRPYSPQLCAQHHHTFADFCQEQRTWCCFQPQNTLNLLCANNVVGDVWFVLALPRPMVRRTTIRARR